MVSGCPRQLTLQRVINSQQNHGGVGVLKVRVLFISLGPEESIVKRTMDAEGRFRSSKQNDCSLESSRSTSQNLDKSTLGWDEVFRLQSKGKSVTREMNSM
ncbi:hypothetical protein TNIN_425671 [Trichonephila inaurata madagascariensis]|uniref:Uncharacterized protein n=1 Tax=Trichonephila inaurata madagascariensis TaxID=2747483 RepID=A0A8X6YRJ6_9ARAC|nr:hypothetical protein TNIN_425671 [Trichonephila inaurata madagascariensis]